MNIRTMGDWALTGSLLIGGAYAYRDISRKGFGKALFEGSTTRPGSIEDTLAKGAVIGIGLFLLSRLAPSETNNTDVINLKEKAS